MHLEDLEDEGEEVDYEDFNLEDFGALFEPGKIMSYVVCYSPRRLAGSTYS